MGTIWKSTGRWAAAGAAALLGVAAGAEDAAASDRWRVDESRNGAIAYSCGGTGAYTACATISCDVSGQILFGLEDLSPSAPIKRVGLITSPGFKDNIRWVVDNRPGRRGKSFVATNLNLGALIGVMKRGASMGAVINDRIKRTRGEITFSLSGSSRAINAVENRCARLASRGGGGGANRGGNDGFVETAPAPVVVETSRWRYQQFRGGGLAQSCGQFGRREICATMFCRRDSGLVFALDGLNEDGAANRAGRLTIGGRSRAVDFTLVEGPRRDEAIYAADHPNTERLSDLLRGGSELEVDIAPRRRPLLFTLAGSSRALNRLEDRCVAVEERVERRQARREQRAQRELLRIYNEELVGVWGDTLTCLTGGWRFQAGQLSTPNGYECDRVLVAEGEGDAVLIRGAECVRRGRNASDVTFEALRDGSRLLLRRADRGGGFIRVRECRVSLRR